jgi:ribonuclease P protein component
VTGCRSYPKAARLRRRAEFLSVQREGWRRHTRHLVVVHGPAPGPVSRFGVTVSTRVGGAVVRNRVKRVLREIFRSYRARLTPPMDVVVIAKPGADTLTYARAATEFARALELTPDN